MDPFSITAGVVGIVAPTLHCVRLLMDDIQQIVDAPGAVKSLNDDLLAISIALTSLQSISKEQWESLGEPVLNQSASAMTLCKDSCAKFKSDLGRWTRHSGDGKLSWRDRTTIGVFKNNQMKSMSEQLQNCRTILTLDVTIATLYGSLRQIDTAQEMMVMISTREAEIKDAIMTTDKQLAQVNVQLATLSLAEDPDDTADDRESAIRQAAVKQTALGGSRTLLEDLLKGIQAAATDARNEKAQVVNNFGSLGEGMQIGVNHGGISGISFGARK